MDKNKLSFYRKWLLCLVMVMFTSAALPSGVSLPNLRIFASTAPVLFVDANGVLQSTAYAMVVSDGAIQINAGWHVLSGTPYFADRVQINGEVHLILEDGAIGTFAQGINVAAGASLHIYAQTASGAAVGAIVATGNNGNAAIGSNDSQGGSIYIAINGGDITATGTGQGAAIGGGASASGATSISIHGGMVNATAMGSGAGIGGGGASGGIGASGGNITIRGNAHVTATGGPGGGAGIGGGRGTTAGGSGGNIFIGDNANVTAQGGMSGAAIGGANGGASGNITIAGGIINATTVASGTPAVIGSGSNNAQSTGTIDITGGSITLTAGSGAALGSFVGLPVNITISGGLLNITSTGFGIDTQGSVHISSDAQINVTANNNALFVGAQLTIDGGFLVLHSNVAVAVRAGNASILSGTLRPSSSSSSPVEITNNPVTWVHTQPQPQSINMDYGTQAAVDFIWGAHRRGAAVSPENVEISLVCVASGSVIATVDAEAPVSDFNTSAITIPSDLPVGTHVLQVLVSYDGATVRSQHITITVAPAFSLEKARAAAQAAINAMVATNDTLLTDIHALVANTANNQVPPPSVPVYVHLYTAPVFIPADIGTPGSITGTLRLEYGGEYRDVIVNLTIAPLDLPATTAQTTTPNATTASPTLPQPTTTSQGPTTPVNTTPPQATTATYATTEPQTTTPSVETQPPTTTPPTTQAQETQPPTEPHTQAPTDSPMQNQGTSNAGNIGSATDGAANVNIYPTEVPPTEPLTAPPTEPAEPLVLTIPSQMISQTHTFEVGEGSLTIEIVSETHLVTIMDTAEVARAVFSEYELHQAYAGANLVVRVVMTRFYNEAEVSADVRASVMNGIEVLSAQVEGLSLGGIMDISLQKRINDGAWIPLTSLWEEITLRVAIPGDLQRNSASFFMLRQHGGVISLLPDIGGDSGTITFRSDRFSTYALVYTAQRFALAGTVHVEVVDPSTGWGFQFGNFTVLVFAPFGYHAWALTNLILCLISVLLAAYIVAKAVMRKRREDKALTEDAIMYTEGNAHGVVWLALATGLALVAAFIFAVVQPFDSETVLLFDFWIITHVLIIATQIVAIRINNRKNGATV